MALRTAATWFAACMVMVFAILPVESSAAGGASPAPDTQSLDREQSAFETAKELGSADAWNAFLAAYPSGFYADMARAYLKKAGGDEAKAAAPKAEPKPTPPPAPPKKAPEDSKSTWQTKTEEAVPEKKKVVCAKNYALQRGKCVLVKSCGPNAHRNDKGECYCNQGYTMQGGICVLPGTAGTVPSDAPACKVMQRQCRLGSNAACARHREFCKTN